MKTKIIIILGVLLVLFVYLYQTKEKIIKTVTKTEIKYDTITQVIDNTKPQQIKKVYIKVPIETIITDTITKIVYKDKEVNEYKYIDTLKNGVVKATILADNIYKRDIELETFNKTTIINTTKTVFKPQVYLGGTTTFNFKKEPLNVGIGVFYVRHKWLGGIGIGYNIINNQMTTNITFALKL